MRIFNWKELNRETSDKIAEIKTGHFYEIQITDQTYDFSQIQNIETIYTSAYPEPEIIEEGQLSATGEVITKRDCQVVDKYDLYLIGITNDDKIVYTGPFKNILEHHVKSKEKVKIEALFGKINKTNLRTGYNRVKR